MSRLLLALSLLLAGLSAGCEVSPRPSGGTKGATTSRPVRRSSTRDAQEDLIRAVPALRRNLVP